jgi:N-acetylneuraminic acid mutarotase
MGGSGYTRTFNGCLNDLWKYNIATNLWTWMKGDSVALQPGIYGTVGAADPLNSPGARQESLKWTDKQGNLWLFGGYGYEVSGNVGYLNDLWNFNISDDSWTWMKGNNSSQSGIYGTIGISASANTPGSR